MKWWKDYESNLCRIVSFVKNKNKNNKKKLKMWNSVYDSHDLQNKSVVLRIERQKIPRHDKKFINK
jgi:hypothetical protein